MPKMSSCQGLIYKERVCNSHSDGVDSKKKKLLKILTSKLKLLKILTSKFGLLV